MKSARNGGFPWENHPEMEVFFKKMSQKLGFSLEKWFVNNQETAETICQSTNNHYHLEVSDIIKNVP